MQAPSDPTTFPSSAAFWPRERFYVSQMRRHGQLAQPGQLSYGFLAFDQGTIIRLVAQSAEFLVGEACTPPYDSQAPGAFLATDVTEVTLPLVNKFFDILRDSDTNSRLLCLAWEHCNLTTDPSEMKLKCMICPSLKPFPYQRRAEHFARQGHQAALLRRVAMPHSPVQVNETQTPVSPTLTPSGSSASLANAPQLYITGIFPSSGPAGVDVALANTTTDALPPECIVRFALAVAPHSATPPPNPSMIIRKAPPLPLAEEYTLLYSIRAPVSVIHNGVLISSKAIGDPTPLEYEYIRLNSAEELRTLLAQWQDLSKPEALTANDDWNAAHLAAMDDTGELFALIDSLPVDNLNAQDRHGVTPLSYAVFCGNVPFVVALLDRLQAEGVEDVFVKDKTGRTAADWAIECSYFHDRDTTLGLFYCLGIAPLSFAEDEEETPSEVSLGDAPKIEVMEPVDDTPIGKLEASLTADQRKQFVKVDRKRLTALLEDRDSYAEMPAALRQERMKEEGFTALEVYKMDAVLFNTLIVRVTSSRMKATPALLDREATSADQALQWDLTVLGGQPPYTLVLVRWADNVQVAAKQFTSGSILFTPRTLQHLEQGFYRLAITDETGQRSWTSDPFKIRLPLPTPVEDISRYLERFLRLYPMPAVTVTPDKAALLFTEIDLTVVPPAFYSETDGLCVCTERREGLVFPMYTRGIADLEKLVVTKTVLWRGLTRDTARDMDPIILRSVLAAKGLEVPDAELVACFPSTLASELMPRHPDVQPGVDQDQPTSSIIIVPSIKVEAYAPMAKSKAAPVPTSFRPDKSAPVPTSPATTAPAAFAPTRAANAPASVPVAVVKSSIPPSLPVPQPARAANPSLPKRVPTGTVPATKPPVPGGHSSVQTRPLQPTPRTHHMPESRVVHKAPNAAGARPIAGQPTLPARKGSSTHPQVKNTPQHAHGHSAKYHTPTHSHKPTASGSSPAAAPMDSSVVVKAPDTTPVTTPDAALPTEKTTAMSSAGDDLRTGNVVSQAERSRYLVARPALAMQILSQNVLIGAVVAGGMEAATSLYAYYTMKPEEGRPTKRQVATTVARAAGKGAAIAGGITLATIALKDLATYSSGTVVGTVLGTAFRHSNIVVSAVFFGYSAWCAYTEWKEGPDKSWGRLAQMLSVQAAGQAGGWAAGAAGAAIGFAIGGPIGAVIFGIAAGIAGSFAAMKAAHVGVDKMNERELAQRVREYCIIFGIRHADLSEETIAARWRTYKRYSHPNRIAAASQGKASAIWDLLESAGDFLTQVVNARKDAAAKVKPPTVYLLEQKRP